MTDMTGADRKAGINLRYLMTYVIVIDIGMFNFGT